MSLGTLVIPALAGYWIVYNTYYFKPTLAQTPPYAFPLLCAVVGILQGAAAVAYARALHVLVHPVPADWRAWWSVQTNFDDLSAVGVVLLSALLFPSVANMLVPATDVARKWLVPDESPLDRLLRESFERRSFVEVVTQAGDSYIGRVVGPKYPWQWPADIVIVPLIIGYRDEQTRHFVRTAAYDRGKKLTNVVIPRPSVLSVTETVPSGLAPPRQRRRVPG